MMEHRSMITRNQELMLRDY